MKTKLSMKLIFKKFQHFFLKNNLNWKLTIIKNFITLVFIGLASNTHSQNDLLSVYDLKSEYLVNPIGLDVKTPRFTWKIKDQRRGAIQKAYKISVGTDSTKVAEGNGSHWNTGKINSDNQMIVYSGKVLQAFQKYYWSLTVWDKNNEKVQSNRLSSFEMGMMESSNWRGSWISDSRDINKKESPYFRKEFNNQKKNKKGKSIYCCCGTLRTVFERKKGGGSPIGSYLYPF